VLNGNCLDVLSELPKQSVNTCITSPPYYGLRDYQTAEWKGGDDNCEHTISHYSDNLKPEVDRPFRGNRSACIKCGAIRKDSQLGLEETPEEYVENMVAVFREVRKVLRDDGTVWLNLGDSYGTEKQLQGIPWRVAFALQADGWYLRQDIIWHKPNPMPESVKDRCTKAHEYIFLLSKNKKYYYDNDAIREPHTWEESKPRPSGMERNAQKYRSKVNYGGGGSGFAGHSGSLKADGTSLNHPDGRNKRSVWTVTTKPFKDAHFATFPPDLIKPCILAGCPEDGTVLDPFGGSGTTGVVANRYGRNAILIELNDEYAEMSRNRIYNDSPLFVDVE
jgi:DNA modification methylase